MQRTSNHNLFVAGIAVNVLSTILNVIVGNYFLAVYNVALIFLVYVIIKQDKMIREVMASWEDSLKQSEELIKLLKNESKEK